jgi:hypothetical protein
MKEWLWKFWTDPAQFRATIRGFLVLIGLLMISGIIDPPIQSITDKEWHSLAAMLVGGSTMIPSSGRKNGQPLTNSTGNAATKPA